MRSATRVVAITVLGLTACLESTNPSKSGGLLLLVPPSARAIASGRVVISGPTDTTVTFAPGETKTIGGLTAGTYTVSLEGIMSAADGGGVGYFTQISGVQVVAGQTSTVQVTQFPSFRPAITSASNYTLDGRVDLTFSAVPGAASYIVQRDTLATFATARDTTVASGNTSPTVSVVLTKSSHVRVLAMTPTNVRGQPSAPVVVSAVTQVTVTPATATIAAGATQTFTAVAKDAGGNTVTGVTFFWASSNQNVALVDQTGVATGIAGGAVTISALGLGLPGNAALTVTGAGPTQLVFTTQPTSSTAGAAVSPAVEVEVRDASGNRVTAARNTVTLVIANNAGGGTLSGSATVNAINGVATFSGLSIDKAATGYTLSAASGTLTGATSSGFNISPGPAARLAFSSQPPTVVEGNDAFTTVVQITDAFGNVVTTATNPVTLEIGRRSTFGGNARLLGTPTVPAVAGVASFIGLRLDLAGSGYTLNARSGSLATAGSDEFRVKLTFQQVDGGNTHTCGFTANASAYCWGRNTSGQLGIGTLTNDSVPRLVTGGLPFKQISAGSTHTCGVTTANDLYCWGNNSSGQLGNGSFGGSFVEPQQVPAPAGRVWEEVSASVSGSFTCATTTSAGSPAGAYCWGANGSSQLGDGVGTTPHESPNLVAGGLNFKRIAAGNAHTCGIATTDLAYCWGTNSAGEAGVGAPSASFNTPQQVSATLGFVQITAGFNHTCTRRTGGTPDVYCWGWNGSGQIANGSFTTPQPNETSISSQLVWTDVAVGGNHTCLIAATAAYCAGAGTSGQLGNNDPTQSQNVRVLVNGGFTYTQITGGGSHTCAVDTTTGVVRCWGTAGDGQIGNGARVQRNTPVQIVQ